MSPTPGPAVPSGPAARLNWDSVLAWRMRRNLLEPVGALSVPDTVARLCGVQAQVASSAELGITLRRDGHRLADVSEALRDRTLIRTWAMRGTLHLLGPEQAGPLLALVGALRRWESPAWQRQFGVTTAELELLAETVDEILADRVLSREALIEAVAERTGDRTLDEHLRSGWSALLKPLAWTGRLCNGPAEGNRVTFTSPATWIPGWKGLPDPAEAARTVIPAYLSAYGPASPKTFDAWLTRGATRAGTLRAWFAAVEDRLATVEVEGERLLARREDLDELADARPTDVVRLLGGFDQYVLGPGTTDPQMLAPVHRSRVSRTAGWISPVVVAGGRVAGVWEQAGKRVSILLFEESPAIRLDAFEAEAVRLATATGREVQIDTIAIL